MPVHYDRTTPYLPSPRSLSVAYQSLRSHQNATESPTSEGRRSRTPAPPMARVGPLGRVDRTKDFCCNHAVSPGPGTQDALESYR